MNNITTLAALKLKAEESVSVSSSLKGAIKEYEALVEVDRALAWELWSM